MTASTPQPTRASVGSVALAGMDGHLVEIGAQLQSAGDPAGHAWLPDDTHQVRDRVRAAIRNAGHAWPLVPVALALPAALTVLVASGQLPADTIGGAVALGEVGLDGSLRPVRGVLSALLAARTAGVRRVILPSACHAEARLVPDLEITAADTLADLVGLLTRADRATDRADAEEIGRQPGGAADSADYRDLADVRCPAAARRALVIAAAGGHPIQLIGPGAVMLGRRLPGLLPALNQEQALEVAAIQSAAGIPVGVPLSTAVPYVAPHYSTSLPALIGGGASGKSGAVSRACHGVLHLDDPEEFGPHRQEVVRVALDEGEVRLVRAGGTVRWPARFHLVLTRRDATTRRLSALLLDRIPIRVELPTTRSTETPGPLGTSAVARDRVALAREWAAARWASIGGMPATNAAVDARHIQQARSLPDAARARLDQLRRAGALTERGAGQVARVEWTICDLDQAAYPDRGQVDEALALRGIPPAGPEDR